MLSELPCIPWATPACIPLPHLSKCSGGGRVGEFPFVLIPSGCLVPARFLCCTLRLLAAAWLAG